VLALLKRSLRDYIERREEGGSRGSALEEGSLLAEVLSAIDSALEKLGSRVRELEESARRLEESLHLLRADLYRAPPPGEAVLPRAGGEAALARVYRELESVGFVSMRRALEPLRVRDRLRVVEELKRGGLVELKLEDDTLFVDPEVYELLVRGLSELRSGDPEEAVEALGRAGRLFNELFRRGLLFFDARRGEWRML